MSNVNLDALASFFSKIGEAFTDLGESLALENGWGGWGGGGAPASPADDRDSYNEFAPTKPSGPIHPADLPIMKFHKSGEPVNEYERQKRMEEFERALNGSPEPQVAEDLSAGIYVDKRGAALARQLLDRAGGDVSKLFSTTIPEGWTAGDLGRFDYYMERFYPDLHARAMALRDQGQQG